MISQYEKSFRQKLESFAPGLAVELLDRGEFIGPKGSEAIQRALLEFLVECACRAQNDEAHHLGRKAILALPRKWVIEEVFFIDDFIDPESDYEVRLFLLLCEELLKDELKWRRWYTIVQPAAAVAMQALRAGDEGSARSALEKAFAELEELEE